MTLRLLGGVGLWLQGLNTHIHESVRLIYIGSFLLTSVNILTPILQHFSLALLPSLGCPSMNPFIVPFTAPGKVKKIYIWCVCM